MKTGWFFLLLLLVSCTQQPRTRNNQDLIVSCAAELPLLKEGMVHKHIICLADTNFSYALYLPKVNSNFTKPEKTFPVIFFFDAHKRGELPVEKYAELAERYGFVLAGSNNSTNGQQAAEMKRAVSAMIDDVLKRFQIDKTRMSTAGFSGGARVAADVALFQNQQISAVIGCAAGFPQINSGFNTNFSYLGMVGDKDFNYLEMKNLDKSLDQTPIHHYLLVYDGKHDWPPEEVMREGFEFLMFDAMKQNPALKDADLIEAFLARNDTIRAKAAGEKDLGKLAAADKQLLDFLQNLASMEKYKSELDSLEKSDSYEKTQRAQKKLLAFERSQQQKYTSAIPVESLQWWFNEIDGLFQKPDDPVSQRLLNYLSLVSYMYASGTLRNNQLKEAEKYLGIYEKVDPENPEVYYLKATLLTRTGKPDQALVQLQKAADNGFDEYERMKSNRNFRLLQRIPGFQEILLQVKNNSGN